jgi:preprotein translocase subunit YajC
MSGNEIALSTIVVIAALALLFAFAISRREKVRRKEP